MLDDRKIKILYAIINNYINSAEPIGSRTISKEYNIGVSPATIRNEMSDLEDLGYLKKTHSSSGRIPSDKAYRLYVNDFLKAENQNIDIEKKKKIKEMLSSQSVEIEQVIQNAAKMLSVITNYTSIAISPQVKQSKIKHLKLIPISEYNILLLIISESGVVKNSVFKVDQAISGNDIMILSNFLNEEIKVQSIDGIIEKVSKGIYGELYKFVDILKSIAPLIDYSTKGFDSTDLYLDGITNLLNFPEYKDLEKAKSLISFIEDKDLLVNLLSNDLYTQDLDIVIGKENIYDQIKDCSIITATYSLGGDTIGKIGLIGPTRMNYHKLINTLQLFSTNINEIMDMFNW